MKMRFFTSLIVLLLTVAPSFAQVRVLEAGYGISGRERDVTDRVRRLVERGRLEFRVSNETFGGDPVRGKPKRLAVTYRVHGETRKSYAGEGNVFRFDLRGGGRPTFDPYAPWNYGHRPPPRSESAIVFVNSTGRAVNVYSLDQYGGWYWSANIETGRRVSFNTRPGQQWLVTDRSNRVISRVAARPGESVVRLGY